MLKNISIITLFDREKVVLNRMILNKEKSFAIDPKKSYKKKYKRFNMTHVFFIEKTFYWFNTICD